SLRDAVTAILPEPPDAPIEELVGEKVKVQDWPGGFTVKSALPIVEPPCTTVITAVPAVATSGVGTMAVNWLALTKLLAIVAPFHWTMAPGAKPAPLMDRVKAESPAPAVLGLNERLGVPVRVGVKSYFRVQFTVWA